MTGRRSDLPYVEPVLNNEVLEIPSPAGAAVRSAVIDSRANSHAAATRLEGIAVAASSPPVTASEQG